MTFVALMLGFVVILLCVPAAALYSRARSAGYSRRQGLFWAMLVLGGAPGWCVGMLVIPKRDLTGRLWIAGGVGIAGFAFWVVSGLLMWP